MKQFTTGSIISGLALVLATTGCSRSASAPAPALLPSGAYATASDMDQAVTVMNAASASSVAAPGSLASIYGLGLAPADSGTLPYVSSWMGVTVSVNGEPCGLEYASVGQINFLLPSDVATGIATVSVRQNGQEIAYGQIFINSVAPGFYEASLQSDEIAIPAAQSYLDDNSDVFNGATGEPLAVNPGTADQPNYLILYGTGFLSADASQVQAGIGGVAARVQAVSHPYVGIDQLNLEIPAGLATATDSEVVVAVKVAGQPANLLKIVLAGTQNTALSSLKPLQLDSYAQVASIRTFPGSPGEAFVTFDYANDGSMYFSNCAIEIQGGSYVGLGMLNDIAQVCWVSVVTNGVLNWPVEVGIPPIAK